MNEGSRISWYVGRLTGAVAVLPVGGYIALGAPGFFSGLLLAGVLAVSVPSLRKVFRVSTPYRWLLGVLALVSLVFFWAIRLEVAPTPLLQIVWIIIALGAPAGFIFATQDHDEGIGPRRG